MSVKIFRLQGTYRQHNRNFRFSREIRALTEEDAIEQLYSLIGSFFRVKRRAISIERIDVIPPEDAESSLIQQLSEVE